ncbi:MAG: hypothetical protein WD770_03675, partial [Actinomycetota bacterium]
MRLGRFGVEAIAGARALAVLGGAPQLRHAAMLAGLEEARARTLCDRLRDAEILGPGLPIDFVHPLVRSAIYGEQSEGERSATHRQAAEVLQGTGAPVRDLAPHLLACAPNGDQWVVARLREAAREAAAVGAYDGAGSYLRRALEEPPEQDVPVRYELGTALMETDPSSALDVLAEVAKRASDEDLRMRALRHLALTHLLVGNVEGAATSTAEALQNVPEADREQTLALEAQLYCFGTLGRGREAATSERIRSVATGLAGKSPGERFARQALAMDGCLAGEPVDQVVELAAAFPPLPWEVAGLRVPVPTIAAKVLAYCGRPDLARQAMGDRVEQARRSGQTVGVCVALVILSEVDRLGGRLMDAEVAARTASEIAGALEAFPTFGWSARMNLVATLIARGDVDGAAELTTGFDLSLGPRVVKLNPWPLEMRAHLRLASGDLSDAAEDLLALGAELEALGFLNPAISPWRQEVAPALASLGRTAEAEKVIAIAEQRARAFGASSLIGTVLRSRALLEPRPKQIDTLEESVAALEAGGPPHELARSLVEMGAALRRHGRRGESREPLRRALELASRSGAGALEERAREELAAVGVRPRRAARTGPAALTASELRA